MILLAIIFLIIYLIIVYINMNENEKYQIQKIFNKFFVIIKSEKEAKKYVGSKR